MYTVGLAQALTHTVGLSLALTHTVGLALALTEEAMFFSFLCRVERLLETSSRVVVPSSEPQAMRHPVS